MCKDQIGRLLARAMVALLTAAPAFAATEAERPELPSTAIPATQQDTQTAAPLVKDRLLISSDQIGHRIERAADRQAVEAFYAARDDAPLWTEDGKLNARAKAVIAQLAYAAADGLDPADYPVPVFSGDAQALAAADVGLTNSVLTYARHLATGRIAPGRVLDEVDYGSHTPDPADILRKIVDAGDAGAALESFNPPHKGFRALKAQLAELRGDGTEATHGRSKRLRAIDVVLANMERWRWLPRELGATYVMVNIPDYSLKVVHDGEALWHTRIVVGKPQTATPLLTAAMDNILINPSWHVPQSIIKNEFIPRYGRDPNIFARMGLEVKRHPDGTLSVTQPPGARNALGRIKFNFYNKFSVYLHDTPAKRLFAAQKRAFSHGCMRVQDPTRLGEIVLSLAMNGPTPNARQISAMFGRGEHSFRLIDKPMVHVTYQTAFVDENGKLALRDDIYGLDRRITDIMHGSERRVADETPLQDRKRAQAFLAILHHVERREAPDAFAYFDNLPAAPRSGTRRVARHVRPQPTATAAEFHSESPQSPLPWPFLAIFNR